MPCLLYTSVVEDGNLIVQVYSFDKETRLNKIINLIENSEELKADAQSNAEEDVYKRQESTLLS